MSYRRKFKKNWYYCICFLICSLINYPYIILRAPVWNVLPKMWCRQKLYTFILKWIRCNVTIFDETRLNRFHFVLCILKFFSFCRIKGRREVRSPLNSIILCPSFQCTSFSNTDWLVKEKDMPKSATVKRSFSWWEHPLTRGKSLDGETFCLLGL